MAKKTTPITPTTITPDDLRGKLQGLQGDVQGKVDDKKTSIFYSIYWFYIVFHIRY